MNRESYEAYNRTSEALKEAYDALNSPMTGSDIEMETQVRILGEIRTARKSLEVAGEKYIEDLALKILLDLHIDLANLRGVETWIDAENVGHRRQKWVTITKAALKNI